MNIIKICYFTKYQPASDAALTYEISKSIVFCSTLLSLSIRVIVNSGALLRIARHQFSWCVSSGGVVRSPTFSRKKTLYYYVLALDTRSRRIRKRDCILRLRKLSDKLSSRFSTFQPASVSKWWLSSQQIFVCIMRTYVEHRRYKIYWELRDERRWVPLKSVARLSDRSFSRY